MEDSIRLDVTREGLASHHLQLTPDSLEMRDQSWNAQFNTIGQQSRAPKIQEGSSCKDDDGFLISLTRELCQRRVSHAAHEGPRPVQSDHPR